VIPEPANFHSITTGNDRPYEHCRSPQLLACLRFFVTLWLVRARLCWCLLDPKSAFHGLPSSGFKASRKTQTGQTSLFSGMSVPQTLQIRLPFARMDPIAAQWRVHILVGFPVIQFKCKFAEGGPTDDLKPEP
jgi:hypothetical protein